jgi:hypothetical protein
MPAPQRRDVPPARPQRLSPIRAYVLAIIGFLAAGLGVLGVCGLRPAVMPAALVAGVAALASQLRQTDAELWPSVALTVDRVEPDRVLVLRNWGAFVLQPTAEGGTRLLIRSTISNERIPAWAAAINFTAFELPHFIMQRRMMLGIKERAERAARG